MIDIIRKTDAYDHLCKVYDEYAASLDSVCRSGCADCCTINVVISALEGYLIAEALEQTGRADILKSLENHVSSQRFIPQYTLNQLAEKIFRGEPVPDEIMNPEWGRCPLLDESTCPIYQVRPFACRCLVSGKPCRGNGYALMSPLTVAVNHVIQQYIEHVDATGFSGNLTDVLKYMRSADNRRRYREGFAPGNGQPFIRHFPARHLLVEPEHRESIGPLLAALNSGGY